jgi:hypothetical protein
MHNQTESPGSAQALPQADDQAPVADGHGLVVSLLGDNSEQLTTEELAQITRHMKDGGVAETTIRGQRVLIVGVGVGMDSVRHLAMAAMARLADAGPLLVMANEPLATLDDHRLALEELVLRVKAPEIQIVADYDGDERRSKGKGKRRKPWESPYGNFGGKNNKGGQVHRNIKHMLPRRGGR